MTNPDVGRTAPTPHLANLVYDLAVLVGSGMIATSEAIARVGADREFRDSSTVARLAEDFWELARTQRHGGSLFTALLHEWTVARAGDDPVALFASSRAFVRAATEVLIARDDAELYRNAYAAADRMIATAVAAAAPGAHYVAGMLQLAPYALDPVNHPDDYASGRMHRLLVERSRPIHVPDERLMPEPAVGLDRAVHHLTAAAEGTTGKARGEVLAHLAFAEYSRHLADGSASLAKVDRWCAEAVALLPPVDKPLAGNRLMWLCLLRGRIDLIAQRSLVVPIDALPEGLVHTVLAGVTAIRIFGTQGRLDACGEIVDVVRRLVADDPDLQAQRLCLDRAAAHSLPGDPLGCPARWQGAQQTSPQHALSGAAAAADRIHALVCGSSPGEPGAVAAALAAVQGQPTYLSRLLRVVVAYWNWMTVVQGFGQHDDRMILWTINAVSSLARTGYRDLATMAVDRLLTGLLDRQLAEGSDVDQHEVAPAIWAMAETVFTQLGEVGWQGARECLSMLLAHWARQQTREGDERAVITMTVLKAPGLAGALTRPGPIPHDREIASAVAWLGADRWAEPATAVQDVILTGYLHSDEREPGATAEQRRANLRRRAQSADIARLMAGASASPLHGLDEIRAALPDEGVLLTVCHGAARNAVKDSLHMVLVPRRGAAAVGSVDFLHGAKNYVQTSLDPDNGGGSTTVHSRTARLMTYVRRLLLEDPLHRDVSRDGALALRLVARQLQLDEGLGKPLTVVIEGGHSRLIFWPHESLYFVPLQLLPFRDGILADHFTVTVVPSVECLFPRLDTITVRPGVTAIACATGGLSVGLPEEPSVHQQAERIAGLFGTRPLTGDDATPAAALEALGTTRYLHLAAHGTQDVDAPLFARVYLAGGALHAHEILQRDLRGTELVTLSACESALLRYDFVDNLHGLAPAFLRSGARAVIGALWPVGPEVAETFFTELYARLANGSTRVDAFRFAQNQARARHPNYRDWGAFTYFGS